MTLIRVPIDVEHAVVPTWDGRRHRNVNQLTLGRLDVRHTNRAEAVAQMGRVIEQFVSTYHEPKVLVFGDRICMLHMWVNEHGPAMEYTIYDKTGRKGCSTMYGDCSWEYLKASARYNLAQMVTEWHDNDSVHAGARFLCQHPEPDWPYSIESFYRYAAWQRAARCAQEAGIEDVHRWACEHDKDEQFQVQGRRAA